MTKKALIFLFCACSFLVFAKAPSIFYLTWVEDPTTSMVIQWHLKGKTVPESTLWYKAEGESQWQSAISKYLKLSGSDTYVHSVLLSALMPATEYLFRFDLSDTIYRFRTLSGDLEKPLRIAIGGDVYLSKELAKKMNRRVVRADPDLVVVGGDIAYSESALKWFKGKRWELRRWRHFLKLWTETMITKEGRVIPLLPVIGNHDVKRVGSNSQEKASLFFELFAHPCQFCSYRVFDVGPQLSLFLLDTGHALPIGGVQAAWLEEELKKREERPFLLAAYHIAAFPSVYNFSSKTAVEIRKLWVPLFEKYGVYAAFEHHNHAYKMTHKIKGEKVDAEGVLYLGDGSWGVFPRKPRSPESSWYLAKSAQKNAFWLMSVQNQEGVCSCLLESFDSKGRRIDRVVSSK